MIDRFKLVEVSEMIQRFCESGDLDLARKLQEKAKKSEGWGGRIEWLIEVNDLIQTLSDFGQRDLARKLFKEEEAKTDKGQERFERLIEAGNRIQRFCESGDLDNAQKQYKAAKELIKRYGDEQPELENVITPTTLLYAYLKAGKINEAFKLFREANKDLRRRVKMEDPELGDACLAASKVDDVWKLFEEAEKLVEKRGEKQSQQWLLEGIALFCYASISSDYTSEAVRGSQEVYREIQRR